MSQMPVNKKEKLVYTVLMVLFMCFGMVLYNTILHTGFNAETVKIAWLTFPVMLPIAFIVEWFLVSKTAEALIQKFVKPTDALPKIILVSALCFVVQMVFIMSFVANIIYGEHTDGFLMGWLTSIPKNFIVAYPLQVVLAGPIVGYVFRKLFPLGTIQDIK